MVPFILVMLGSDVFYTALKVEALAPLSIDITALFNICFLGEFTLFFRIPKLKAFKRRTASPKYMLWGKYIILFNKSNVA